jgi:Leucine-rich repeat (LRR) protein
MATAQLSRRRWRFSLRAMLLMVTVGAVGLAIFTQWQRTKFRENDAAREVLNRGGSVGYFNGWTIQNRGWLVRELSLVLPHDCLYTVKSISFREAGDEELTLFPAMRHLEEVNLEGCQVTDAGLANLKGLTNLTFLELSSTPLTNAGLLHFQSHRRLKQLWLEQTQISDVSLPLIVQNRGLTHLDLAGTQVTDQGCAHLAGLTHLEMLSIHSTGITTNVTPTLKQLPKLKYLYLMRTSIGDDAVPDLGCLKLQQLDIRFTKITPDGYEKLKQALPNCNIEWLPPVSSFAPQKTEPFAERKATIDTHQGISRCPTI